MESTADDAFSRTELIIGKEALASLAASTVAIFGLGGVGSWVAEALARAGVGGFVLVDSDLVASTNLNRQILALHSTIGKPKVEVMAERIHDINPEATILAFHEFYEAKSAGHLLPPGLSYVVDAIDTISSKLDLIVRAREAGFPVISAMGGGNKLDPARFEVADIFSTSICPLARVIRTELRKLGLRGHKVVYSRENPIRVDDIAHPGTPNYLEPGASGPGKVRRSLPGSLSFVTACEGFVLAAEVVKDIVSGGEGTRG